MIGAQALLRTLTGCGVEVCFSNPGTSEMHFVAALDGVPEMRGVLCLFEGAATGAADGYGRMTGRPAAALLHLGPGLANGLANLHNARRAHTPLLAVVGDHATWHKQFDSPLESDIDDPSGAGMLGETFPARHERGAGLPAIDRLAYLAEFAIAQLGDVRHLILAGARAPVSFFAYPRKPSSLVPEGCQVHLLAEGGDDIGGALTAPAGPVAPDTKPLPQEPARPALPEGDLTGESAAAVIGALLPEGAIVSDDANTSGVWLPAATAGAPPPDRPTLTGGAIGQGLPLATGAAIASPGRSILALEADGSAMYTISALWTQAREGLDITTVIFSNRAYAILGMELGRVGAAVDGRAAQSLLELSRPSLDFTALARGMGVPASHAATAAEFAPQL